MIREIISWSPCIEVLIEVHVLYIVPAIFDIITLLDGTGKDIVNKGEMDTKVGSKIYFLKCASFVFYMGDQYGLLGERFRYDLLRYLFVPPICYLPACLCESGPPSSIKWEGPHQACKHWESWALYRSEAKASTSYWLEIPLSPSRGFHDHWFHDCSVDIW